MTADDLRQTFERLARGPTAATQAMRHLYLWHGTPTQLETLVPSSLLGHLDLYALTRQLPRAPYALDEARRVLRAQIEEELRGQTDHAPRQVLVVNGCSLLVRYRVPLQPFYSFVNDSRAAVLVVCREDTGFTPPVTLPGFVRLAPTTTFDALSQAVGERHNIQGG